jgi:hypothetical protein
MAGLSMRRRSVTETINLVVRGLWQPNWVPAAAALEFDDGRWEVILLKKDVAHLEGVLRGTWLGRSTFHFYHIFLRIRLAIIFKIPGKHIPSE